MPLIMGILNVTPDSFSDGGRHDAPDAALRHAEAMVAEGADVIDVGGESTRPGSMPVPAAEQLRRVVPVILRLRERLPRHVRISIDTRSPEVGRAALDAGADWLNDVSAGAEPGMLELAAERAAPIVLMHMQGTPETMQLAPRYGDVVGEVLSHLLARAAAAERCGASREQLLLDPGIGFGKTREHNLSLLAALPRFVATGYRILLGTSRKRFMGALCAETDPHELIGATCATTALATQAGVHVVRVHDVRANRQAAIVAAAITGADLAPVG